MISPTLYYESLTQGEFVTLTVETCLNILAASSRLFLVREATFKTKSSSQEALQISIANVASITWV